MSKKKESRIRLKKARNCFQKKTFTGCVRAYCCHCPFCLLLWGGKKNSNKTRRDLPQAGRWLHPKACEQWAAFWKASLKPRDTGHCLSLSFGHFLLSVSDRKITHCHRVPSIFVLQVAPGEFNLESVGLDTLVINQLCAHVCASVRVCVCVFACSR